MDRIATASADFAVDRVTREDVADIAALLRDEQGTPVGMLQLTFVQGLRRGGAMRMVVEGVRVHSSTRGSGLGGALMGWAHDQARARGVMLVQLTSEKRRPEAHRSYERLGYVATLEGFKLEV